jgi:hypothetical protein
LRGADGLMAGEPLHVAAGLVVLLGTLAATAVAITTGALIGGALAAIGLFKPLTDKRGSMFGICWGSDGRFADLKADASLPLTDWLHVRLQRLAGRPVDDPEQVVTMGMLKRERDVTLKLVTTNLTLGQPYLLPMKRGAQSFFFRRDELERLFPAPVIRYLESRWRQKPLTRLKLHKDIDDQFVRLPMGDDLPVLVAVRMSLSFPLLISAVRLHSFTHAAYERYAQSGIPAGENDVEEHWFSDGGIANNFPIHIFDGWMSDVPTFGITLYDSPVASTLAQYEDAPEVVVPKPSHFQHARPQRVRIESLLDFVRAIFETAQSYRDNAQSCLPGYRERIAQVFLKKTEGGLNLTMPPDVVASIQEKGKRAGATLVSRFVENGELSHGFLEHRWVHLHVLMAQLENELEAIASQPGWQGPAMEGWRRVVEAQLHARPAWYRPKKQPWCDEALGRVEMLFELAERWRKAREEGISFSAFPPLPESVLRISSEL